jgi:hypothetical protein
MHLRVRVAAQLFAAWNQSEHHAFSAIRERDTMKRLVIISAVLFAAPLQSANAGLGESSSPQRLRCETQASAKFAMWQWFSRRDFVQRCMSTQGGTKIGKSKKRISAR